MKPRSVRYMEDAKRKFWLGCIFIVNTITCGSFAVSHWISNDEWPMTILGFCAVIHFIWAARFLDQAVELFKDSRRERYWENRRLADRFIDSERI